MIFKLFCKIFGTSGGRVPMPSPPPPCPTIKHTAESKATIDKIAWLIENGDWEFVGSGIYVERQTHLYYSVTNGVFEYENNRSFLNQHERKILHNRWVKKEESLSKKREEQKSAENAEKLNNLLSKIESISERSKSI